MKGADLGDRADAVRPVARKRKVKRRLSRDEAQYRLIAAAAGAAVAMLIVLVAVLALQLS